MAIELGKRPKEMGGWAGEKVGRWAVHVPLVLHVAKGTEPRRVAKAVMIIGRNRTRSDFPAAVAIGKLSAAGWLGYVSDRN